MAKNQIKYDFCIPITLPINLLGKEKVITLDVFGKFETINQNLVPKAVEFIITKIDNENILDNFQSVTHKAIKKLLEENPLQISQLILNGIKTFAIETVGTRNSYD